MAPVRNILADALGVLAETLQGTEWIMLSPTCNPNSPTDEWHIVILRTEIEEEPH